MLSAGLRLLICCSATALALPGADSYADPASCAQCHAAIAETYARTGMGRSFFKPAAANRLEDLAAKPFYHAPSDLWYGMTERDGALYQRRWQIGYDGKETNAEEKRVDYTMGSGNHGRTYLHLTPRNTLQQLPLGWYAEKGGYFAMNPGYDRPDSPGSTRAITYKCMFCHNGYPEIPKGNEQEGAEARFTSIPEGIDCQRCHGPGRKHVEAAGFAPIVNPAKLAPERALEVCLQCHLEPTSRALPGALQRKGRAPFSFVPGQALGDFRLAFDKAVPDDSGIEIAQAGYRFLRSQCYLKSAGKLLCTTCHNPHEISHGSAEAARYNAICRNCHRSLLAVAPHGAEANCVACHMPKMRTEDAVHIAMTDHQIRRLPVTGDPLADRKETRETTTGGYRGEVAPFYPARLKAVGEDALDRAVAQIKDGSNLKAGLPQLAGLILRLRPANAAYYEELAEGYRMAGDGAHAVPYYEEAARRAPESALLLLRLGNMLIDMRLFARAETPLRRAVALAPEDPLAWGLLGWALFHAGKAAEAREDLERAIRLDPESPELYNYLGSVLVSAGDGDGAETKFRTALALQPGIAAWQTNLGNLLASRGSYPEALYRLRQSIRLKPEDAATRVDYARMLMDVNLSAQAEEQARAALSMAPGSADAHECLALLLSAKGDAASGVKELREALRLQPDFGRVQFELGAALLQSGESQSGDRSEALTHLRIAAQSNDAQARAAALELIRKSGLR